VEFNKLEISLADHVLFYEITAYVTVRPVEDSTPPVVTKIKIEGDEYQAWGSDDNYILELIASKLGIQLH
jgi:hypothetical protein